METYEPRPIKYSKPPDFEPIPDFPEGHHNYGKPRCQAWSPNQGRQCLGIAMRGGDKCRVHGGRTPKGIASPHFKSGRYSETGLPAGYLETYHKSLSDSELLSYRDDLALLEARQVFIITNLDKMPSFEIWKQLNFAYEQFERATKKQDPQASATAINDIRSLIKRGLTEWMQWQEIMSIQEQKRKLGESERKRLTEMQQLVTVERVLALMAALTDSVKRNVTDRTILSKIQRDFERLSAGKDA